MKSKTLISRRTREAQEDTSLPGCNPSWSFVESRAFSPPIVCRRSIPADVAISEGFHVTTPAGRWTARHKIRLSCFISKISEKHGGIPSQKLNGSLNHLQ